MTDPPSFDQINKRITNKLMKKKQEVTRRSHSLIPGQCNHEGSMKDKAADDNDKNEDEPRDDLEAVQEAKDVLQSDMSVMESQVSTPKKQQPCIFELKEKKGREKKRKKAFKWPRMNSIQMIMLKK